MNVHPGARVPRCPIREGERCNLCQVNVTGPHDCGLVWLVLNDPDLRAEYDRRRREESELRRSAEPG